MRFSHSENSLTNVQAAGSRIAKFLPIIQPPARDYVVYSGERPLRVI
ncbi:MAG TPA: hypothetical protein VFM63_15230 [Pyrinomonadaceae bacterium]|nr:hypothetical protein [Pyrinomonadaceae bacterium]